MIRPNEATFTAQARFRKYPYIYVTIPRDIQKLLELYKGDFIEVHVKVVKRGEHGKETVH